MSAFLDAALEYAARGWRVHPLRERGKEPRLQGWPEKAATDASVIRGWWNVRPYANVGIATGEGLAVLDVDPRNGGDETLKRLLGQGRIHTATVHTGGGGQHFYFRAPPGQRSGKLRWPFNHGLDLQAAGRQVVAPPSIGPGGKQYTWDPGAPSQLAPLPDWIGDKMGVQRRPAPPSTPRGDDFLETLPPPVYVRDLAGLEVGEGGGKACCPFHGDSNPSLHIYPTAERGWYCYGCEVGGGIYQFAALAGGFTLPLRGAAFLRVEAVLLDFYEKQLGVSA